MLYEDITAKLLGLEDVIVKKVWDEKQEKHIAWGTNKASSCGTPSLRRNSMLSTRAS